MHAEAYCYRPCALSVHAFQICSDRQPRDEVLDLFLTDDFGSRNKDTPSSYKHRFLISIQLHPSVPNPYETSLVIIKQESISVIQRYAYTGRSRWYLCVKRDRSSLSTYLVSREPSTSTHFHIWYSCERPVVFNCD